VLKSVVHFHAAARTRHAAAQRVRRILRHLLLAALACVASDSVRAQVSGQIALVSDYRWRGVSLTDEAPALQGSLSYDHASGLFAGLFGSNVELRPGNGGLGVQAFGGYARRWRDDAAWDVGAVGYKFPRSEQGRSYDYLEAFAGVTVEQFGARMYVSNDYYGNGHRSAYATASLGLPLTPWLTLGVHVGVLQLWPQDSGARSTFEISLVAADTQRCARAGCDPGLVVGLSRGF
jgi:uncharacterized protein (TIGR02001 family)